MTTRESRWTEQDRAEILALAIHRAEMCPCGCGHKAADTTSHEETGPKFQASRVACRARMALIDARRAANSDPKNPSPYAEARLWRTEMTAR